MVTFDSNGRKMVVIKKETRIISSSKESEKIFKGSLDKLKFY